MDLITETKRRLDFLNNELEQLKECADKPVSLYAREYLNNEISRTEKNVEYYSKVMEVLEK